MKRARTGSWGRDRKGNLVGTQELVFLHEGQERLGAF
jgi:hypothetical protein